MKLSLYQLRSNLHRISILRRIEAPLQFTLGGLSINFRIMGVVDRKRKVSGPTQPLKPRNGESDEFEFGGSLGAASLMLGFPLLMWFVRFLRSRPLTRSRKHTHS